TKALITPSTESALAQAGRLSSRDGWPVSCEGSSPVPVAKRGIKASIGMTAMSWKSNTAKELCPACVFINPFSFRVWRTMAVEDSANIIPMASATCQLSPKPRARPPTIRVVARNLRATKTHDGTPQTPQERGLKLQSDDKEHHDHPELG